MYPSRSLSLQQEIPAQATFWVPDAEDITDEGFGPFHDVWDLSDVSIHEAKGMLAREQSLFDLADRLAGTAEQYESLAQLLELNADQLADEDKSGLTDDQLEELERALSQLQPGLDGLELGVASAVYALSSRGLYPAASCRGHIGSTAWSDTPVVFFAGRRSEIKALQPLVAEANCGLAITPPGPDFLVIEAGSPVDMLRLSELLVG